MMMPQTISWEPEETGLIPYLVEGKRRRKVTWTPQSGSQFAFLRCPVPEALYEGTRGPGKTDAMLVDFAQHTGQGYGAEWRGILFRRTYKELEDVINKSTKLFAIIFPEAKYNSSSHEWKWPTGEVLLFRYFEHERDYWSYHGHAYPWIGWEELCTWPSDSCYKSMFSCNRSTVPGIPLKVRSTANPYGPGHNWVKARWNLPIGGGRTVGKVIRGAVNPDGSRQPDRVAIHGRLTENRVLLHADPGYLPRLRESARNPAELKAWVHGDWNIVAGGMFDDVWKPEVHVIPDFPFDLIPKGWYIDRSYDHGQSAPFSVGWWARSNGEPIEYKGKEYGAIPGDMFRIAEWYGCRSGRPNEGVNMLATKIADGIVERENRWELKVKAGPADNQIYTENASGGTSVADDMKDHGVRWTKSDKGPGSRVQGWQQVRKYLENAIPPEKGVREAPGLFIMQKCDAFQTTVPVLPRDDKNLDDVDTDAEDHVGDEVRYRLRRKKKSVAFGGVTTVEVN